MIPVWSGGPIIMTGYIASNTRRDLGQKVYLEEGSTASFGFLTCSTSHSGYDNRLNVDRAVECPAQLEGIVVTQCYGAITLWTRVLLEKTGQ
jgi:hypothetical protein